MGSTHRINTWGIKKVFKLREFLNLTAIPDHRASTNRRSTANVKKTFKKVQNFSRFQTFFQFHTKRPSSK